MNSVSGYSEIRRAIREFQKRETGRAHASGDRRALRRSQVQEESLDRIHYSIRNVTNCQEASCETITLHFETVMQTY